MSGVAEVIDTSQSLRKISVSANDKDAFPIDRASIHISSNTFISLQKDDSLD